MIGSLMKLALLVLIVLGIIYGYQFMTGKSIATLPQEIVDKIQHKDPATNTTKSRYYTDPEKSMPKN